MNGEFDAEIISELKKKGYTGEKLISEFERMRKSVRPAIEKMITEADNIARDCTDYAQMEDIFE